MKVYLTPLLKVHMAIFRVIGYETFPLQQNPEETIKNGLWRIVWTAVLLLTFNATAFLAIFGDDDFLFSSDMFGNFNDTLKVVIADIAVTSAYLEVIFRRSSIYKFWNMYAKLQEELELSSRAKDHRQKFKLLQEEISYNRRFFILFYTCFTLELLGIVLFVKFQDMSRHLILFWSVFAPFIYAVHMRNMQFIFYIELIRLELIKVKDDLQLICDYSRFMAHGAGFRGFQEFLRCKIKEKQQMYQWIYEMFENFQNAFNISIVTVLTMIYVRVVVDSYFSYYTALRGWNITGSLLMLALVPATFQIPVFLITSKCCMEMVKLITANLHSIISQFDYENMAVSVQLQNFSLQIFHQCICINGLGTTTMDGYALTRTLGSITTYMIFFIQLMPKISKI